MGNGKGWLDGKAVKPQITREDIVEFLKALEVRMEMMCCFGMAVRRAILEMVE